MNPELLGNGLWLFLASQGSPEGLWQVPWGGQSLAGPLSGGQAQDWMVAGGEGIPGR